MTKDKYSKAYTEVLEILKYLPQYEYNKIPQEKIKFFEENKDNSYKFSINPEKLLEEQNISIEANSIIVVLFRDYFASEKQKEKLNVILQQNEDDYQAKLRRKYNPDDIFKKKEKKNYKVNKEIQPNNLPIEVKKQNFFKKFLNYIKYMILKYKKRSGED